jgi:WD40 repeat protein
MNTCPPDQQLEVFLAESLSPSECAALEEHLATCSRCQQRLQELTNEPIPERWRELLTRLPDNQSMAIPACLDRLAMLSLDQITRDPAAVTVAEAGMETTPATWPEVPGYEMLGELSRGGMGVVHKARQIGLNRLVALKMILAGAHASKEEIARFEREAEAVARLQHPNIVQIHEVGEHAGRPFFSLEYVEGGNLAQRLDGTPWPARRAAELTATLARAMEYAHQQGIVHRDLTPSNVLVTADGTPKIADFGLAKFLMGGGVSPTRTGSILGTPSYMAPEQAQANKQAIGPATDVYALGAILYELLTGRPPFKEETPLDTALQVVNQEPVAPSRLHAKVPQDLETICLKCLHKESSKRYGSARELADDLQRFLSRQPIQARPVSTWERVWIWARRRPAVAALLAVGFVAVLALVGVGVALMFNEQLQATNAQLAGAYAETEGALREAERARKQAELYQYLHHIARAQADWRDGNLGRVRQLLDDCPRQQRGWEWAYLERLCHGEILTLNVASEYGGLSLRFAFSPDGTRIATASNDQVRVWDARTGQLLRSLPGHKSFIMGVAFSPDGCRLTSASHDRTVKVWEANSGQLERTLGGDNGRLQSVAFSPDGTRLVSGSQDKTVIVWESTTGKRLFTLQGHGDGVRNVVFSPDGMRFASVSEDVVKLWDAASGRELHTFQGHKRFVFWDVAFSPDGTQLASGGVDQHVMIWDVATGAEVHRLRGPLGLLCLAFNPDGRWLVTGSNDRIVRVWDLSTGQIAQTLRGHSSPVSTVQFSPDGSRLASASYDGMVKVWAATNDQEARSIQGFADWVTCVAFSPDGTCLASGSYGSGAVKIWDTTTGQLRNSLLGHKASVFGVAFSPDGKVLASASEDRTIRLWDPKAGQPRDTFTDRASEFSSVAFSPDGQRLACGTKPYDQQNQPGEVEIWDVGSGQQIVGPLRGHTEGVTTVAFSPDGTQLAAASFDGTARVWDSRSGRHLFTLPRPPNNAVGLSFSPDGKHLATGNWDKTVNIWDARTGAELQTLRGHYDVVNAVTHTRDGTRLASASGEVKIWDMTSGQEALTLGGYRSFVWSLAFSADGTRLASGSGDGIVKIWDARPWTADSATEREALGLLEHLFTKPLCKADVLAYLTSSPTITPQARQMALGLVERYREEDNPDRYQQAAWDIVRQRYGNAFQYRFALSQAETACRLAPDQGKYLTTLGAAQYRAGQYLQARATLERADLLNRAVPAGLALLAQQLPQALVTLGQAQPLRQAVPANLAFLAMTHHRLGQKELAQTALSGLRQIADKPEWAKDHEVQSFFREVETVLGSKPAVPIRAKAISSVRSANSCTVI